MADDEGKKEKPKLALVTPIAAEEFDSESDWTVRVFSRDTLVFSGSDVVEWGPWQTEETDAKFGYMYVDQKIANGIRRTFIGPDNDERLVEIGRAHV